MKSLGKLVINSEKLLKNEELLNLRGGYTPGDGTYPKIDACGGKQEGDTCSFYYSGTNVSYGWCKRIAPLYTLHCSDIR